MKTVLYSAVFILAAGAASACPWANKTLAATIQSPFINFTFTFDDTCATVEAQREGRQMEVVQTVFINNNRADHGWAFEYDLFEFLFRVDGERSDARQGGARRPMRVREQ